MAHYVLPDLPYDYAALEPHYSGEILELHHDKHHAAYVAGANTTLESSPSPASKDDFGAIVGLEKTLAFNVSGHVLHSIFWKNLSPDGGDRPDGDLGKRHRRALRVLRRVQGPAHPGDDHHPGLGLGRARAGSHSASAFSSSRSTTTRATSGTARCRSSSSTPGSTPSTCSTRT